MKHFPKLLIIILLVGLFMRLYQSPQWFLYSHDQDLLGWFIKDIVQDGNLRLIGQETSQQGVFIGPLFYYLSIPFYLLFNWDPIGGVVFVTVIGLLTILSYWFVFSRVFGKQTGLIVSLLYASSYAISLTDREVVPTTPVMLWSVWFLYVLHLLVEGKQKYSWIIAGILVGTIWHLNMGLVLLTPLILIAQIFSKKRINLKSLLIGSFISISLMTPFVVFEIRHNFSQTSVVINSFITGSESGIDFVDKFDRVMQLASKNVHRLVLPDVIPFPHLYTFIGISAIFIFLVIKKQISRRLALFLGLWVSIFILFFSFNSIVISEYYLNAMTVVWLATISLTINYFLNYKRMRFIGYSVLGILALFSFYSFFTYNPTKSGYIERKELVNHIKEDAAKNSYPCVSVSYITKPRYNLGYRYLYWLEKMHVNNPSSGAPVYTIVFPHSMVDRIDKSFGALGLIYPDYQRYNTDLVSESCSGENSNLTDPLFGYTK